MGEIPYQQGRAIKSSDKSPSTNHLINCPGASCRGALPFCASSYCMLTHWKERHGGEEMPQWLEKEIAISSSERKAVLQWGARSSAMSRKRKAAERPRIKRSRLHLRQVRPCFRGGGSGAAG